MNRSFWAGALLITGLMVLNGCSDGGSSAKKDTSPDAFEFQAKSDAPFETWQEFGPIVVSGIDTATSISVTGGEYKIDNGDYTAKTGKVNAGNQVTVRLMSNVKGDSEARAVLKIGDKEAEALSTTGPDTIPPEVKILFPTPYTMTQDGSVFIRGQAEDVNGQLDSVLVNGIEVDSDDGLKNWTVTVPLPEEENTITVVATDEEGNEDNSQTITVKMDPEGGVFPNSDNPTARIGRAGDFAVINEREYLVVPDYGGDAIVSVDLESGVREILFQADFQSPQTLLFRSINEAYLSDRGFIYRIDIESQSIFTLAETSENGLIRSPRGIMFGVRDEQDGLYIADGKNIIWLDLETNSQTLLYSGEIGNSYPDGATEIDEIIFSLKPNEVGKDLLFLSNSVVYSVDFETGILDNYFEDGLNSQIRGFEVDSNGVIYTVGLSDGSLISYDFLQNRILYPHENTDWSGDTSLQAYGIVCKDEKHYCLVCDAGLNTIFVMDKESGYKTILSRSPQ